MAGDTVRLIVEWPNGTKLPVRVATTATGADLIGLLRFSCRPDQLFFLLFDGVCLNPKRKLSRQRICADDVIQVVIVADNDSSLDSSDDGFVGEEMSSDSIDAVCCEILRITDVQFNLVESHKKGGLIYQQLIADSDSDEPAQEHPTVVPPPPTGVSSDPLPEFPGDTGAPEPRAESRAAGHSRALMSAGQIQGEWKW
jgi:hypothetical protein